MPRRPDWPVTPRRWRMSMPATAQRDEQPDRASAPAAEATPVERSVPTAQTVNASAGDAADEQFVRQIRRQMAAETRRIDTIRKLCAGRHPDLEARAIEEGWDETKAELHVLRASRPQVPAVTTPQRPTSPQVFEAVALMSSGLPMHRIEAAYSAPILEAAERLRGVGIQEFCELVSGQRLPRFRRDATGWLQAACGYSRQGTQSAYLLLNPFVVSVQKSCGWANSTAQIFQPGAWAPMT